MKISKVLGAASAFGSTLYLTSATFVQAEGEAPIAGGTGANQWLTGLDGVQQDLTTWIPDVVNLAIGLAALVCVVILIASGYSYITAAGDEVRIEKATKTLTFAIVGLVICFIAVILVRFVLTSVLNQQS